MLSLICKLSGEGGQYVTNRTDFHIHVPTITLWMSNRSTAPWGLDESPKISTVHEVDAGYIRVLAYHPMLHCFKEIVSEGSDLKMQHLEFLWEQGCVMTVRCSLSLQKHTGNHNTFLGRQTGDGREHLMSRVFTGLPFLSLTHVSAWAHSCIGSPPWSESEVCTGQQALISILLSFIPCLFNYNLSTAHLSWLCNISSCTDLYLFFF